MGKKILVACFSASGVTKKVDEEIARTSGGDFFEIVPKEPYTRDDLNWTNQQSRSSVEMKDPSARPEIAWKVDNMGDYSTREQIYKDNAVALPQLEKINMN